MELEQYVKDYYESRPDWFVEEVKSVHNMARVNKVLDAREYLSGKHTILNRQPEEYNGKKFYPRRIVLQYAKTLLNFQTAYLIQNPITLTGDEKVVSAFNKVHKQGKYDRLNFTILDKVIKYGNVAEYAYLDDNKQIRSKLIDPADSYPVFNIDNEMIAFIEHYNVDTVDYYNVFTKETVYKYDNLGGSLRLTGKFANLSGLPIFYASQSENDDNFGRSDLEDIISILDAMEDLLSKYTDSLYKYINPIPVAIGQQLKGDGLPRDIAGGGLVLDNDSDFKMVGNQLDFKSFDILYKTLLQSLLDISSTPAVSMNKTDISNLSEVSIKLLFSLANVKAGWNEQFMRNGIEQRFNKIRRLLALQGVIFSDDEFNTLDVVFSYAMPLNNKEIIDNLKVLNDMGGTFI